MLLRAARAGGEPQAPRAVLLAQPRPLPHLSMGLRGPERDAPTPALRERLGALAAEGSAEAARLLGRLDAPR